MVDGWRGRCEASAPSVPGGFDCPWFRGTRFPLDTRFSDGLPVVEAVVPGAARVCCGHWVFQGPVRRSGIAPSLAGAWGWLTLRQLGLVFGRRPCSSSGVVGVPSLPALLPQGGAPGQGPDLASVSLVTVCDVSHRLAPHQPSGLLSRWLPTAPLRQGQVAEALWAWQGPRRTDRLAVQGPDQNRGAACTRMSPLQASTCSFPQR